MEKHKLISRLFTDEGRWGLQVIQQALALLAHIPVRLLDTQKVFKNLSETDKERIDRDFSKATLKSSINGDLIDHFKDRANSPWITRPSNMHPLIEYLREDTGGEWLAMEHAHVGAWQRKSGANMVAVHDFYESSLLMASYRVSVSFGEEEKFDGRLVLGPVFQPTGDNSGESFAKGIINPFVENLPPSYSEFIPFLSHDPIEVRLRGSVRGWVDKQQLIATTIMLGRAFKCLLETEFDPSFIHTIERCTYNCLAQIVFLIHRENVRRMIRETLSQASATFRFDLLQRRSNLGLFATFEGGTWRMRLTERDEVQPKVAIYDPPRSTFTSELLDLETTILQMKRNLEVSYGTLHYGYANERLRRLRNTLEDRFGLVSAHPGTHREPEDFNNAYRPITRELINLFAADTATIFIYNHPEKTLETRVIDFHENVDEARRSDWRKASADLMRKIAHDLEKRLLSISYRCVDSRKPRFCRAASTEKGRRRHDPEEEAFLVPEGVRSCSSVMAVPLSVHGKSFGVLEFGGFSPYQFRYDNLILAEYVGQVIGAFLYQKEVLTRLGQLSDIVVDVQIPDEEKFHKICAELAHVFLAEACVLFMTPVGEKDTFCPFGWFNREDLDRIPDTERHLCRIDTSRDDSPLIMALNTNSHMRQFSIGELKRDYYNWEGGLMHRKGAADNFDWIVIVPLKDQSTGQAFAGLSLYYKKESRAEAEERQMLSKNWEPTVRFLSFFVALLVAPIWRRQAVEDRIQKWVHHELTNHINLLTKFANDILRFLDNPIQENQSLQDAYQQMFYDILPNIRVLSAQRSRLKDYVDQWISKDFWKLVNQGRDPSDWFSRELQDGELEEANEDVCLPELLDTAGEILSQKYESKQLRCYTEFDSDDEIETSLYIFPANRKAVSQVIHHLVDNALKHCLEKTRVTFSVKETSLTVELSVRNTGSALRNSKEQYHLFIEGYQGSNVKDGGGRGGLGLSLARKLCQRLEADLRVDLEPNSDGSCDFIFTVSFSKSPSTRESQ